jgi:hypothetical protein
MRLETQLTVIIERSCGICFPDVNYIWVDDLGPRLDGGQSCFVGQPEACAALSLCPLVQAISRCSHPLLSSERRHSRLSSSWRDNNSNASSQSTVSSQGRHRGVLMCDTRALPPVWREGEWLVPKYPLLDIGVLLGWDRA